MLTAYGALVVTLMMILYALESRSSWFTEIGTRTIMELKKVIGEDAALVLT